VFQKHAKRGAEGHICVPDMMQEKLMEELAPFGKYRRLVMCTVGSFLPSSLPRAVGFSERDSS
jgi:hypothetical protein